MWMLRFAWMILLAGVAVGCGGGRESGVPVESPPPQVQLKAILEETAAQGQLPAIEALQENLEAMKASDPAKAADLQTDYEVLITLTQPEEIKAKAKEMVNKL